MFRESPGLSRSFAPNRASLIGLGVNWVWVYVGNISLRLTTFAYTLAVIPSPAGPLLGYDGHHKSAVYGP